MRQVLKINQQELKKALEAFDRKVATEMAIDAEFTRLVKDYDYSLKSLLENPRDYFYTAIEVVYSEQNTLRLSGLKLVELMQIDTSELLRLADGYEGLKHISKPKKDDYTDYAESPDEIKRLEYSKEYILLITRFEKDFGRVFPREAMLSHSPQCVYFNHYLNTYEPNTNFVKDLRVR
jgi:hypothetical protein